MAIEYTMITVVVSTLADRSYLAFSTPFGCQYQVQFGIAPRCGMPSPAPQKIYRSKISGGMSDNFVDRDHVFARSRDFGQNVLPSRISSMRRGGDFKRCLFAAALPPGRHCPSGSDTTQQIPQLY
jgi:hypothetical protein